MYKENESYSKKIMWEKKNHMGKMNNEKNYMWEMYEKKDLWKKLIIRRKKNQIE